MSRYIDADVLIEELESCSYETWSKGVNRTWWAQAVNVKDNIKRCIDRQPTADVVEVVRKAVKGYEGFYEVDQFGRVYSVDRLIPVDDNGREYNKALCGKQMKQGVHSKGYKIVSLTKEGKTKTVFVHRIVAEAFINNQDNLPMVNHKDEDKTNNFVENLEWCTAKYNRSYGKAIEKHAKAIKGRKHTEEHKQKIAVGVKRSYGERKEENEG
jgi:hypothetical protein